MNSNMTKKYLHERLTYCPDSGNLYWKERPRSDFKTERAHKRNTTIYAGKIAGYIWAINKNGYPRKYVKIGLNGKLLSAHRLIWLMVHNESPKEVDHINSNGIDNSLSNLRGGDKSLNQKNARLRVDNISGYSGIYWKKANKKWCCQIMSKGKHIYLGLFSNLDDAIRVKKEASVKYGFHENHGTPRPQC